MNKSAIFDIGSPEALELFWKAAKAYSKKATKSKAAVMTVLIAEGMFPKAENLTKRYR